jgi:hypothetical protein
MERINWLIKKRNTIFKNRKPAVYMSNAAKLIRYCIIICSLAIMSCAKMPSQAVDLSYSLRDEGQRMHEMNIALVAYVFNEKKRMVNEFINKEYSPALIENFKAILPAGIDVKKDLVEIMQAINPKIEERKDSLLKVLQSQQMVITQQLNADYKVYAEAFAAMQNLLVSATKLNQQRTSVYENIKTLSNNRINLQGIDNALDQFIKGAGSIGEKTLLLTNAIQSSLK